MNGSVIFDLEGTLVDVGGERVSQVFIDESLLARLSEEHTLAIVTGATRTGLEYVLRNTYLGQYFKGENTITRDECATPKATGVPFQRLLDSGVAKPAVVIGDSDGDRDGSAAAGVPFVRVQTLSLQNDTHAMSGYVAAALQKLSAMQ